MRKTKSMKKTNESGFTLIELLVVISIIGLLSTMAVISLNSARSKARDAKRVSDIKGLSTMLEMERANQGDTVGVGTCVLADALTYTCTGGELTAQVANFKDPVTPATACTNTTTTTCGYSISTAAGAAAAAYGDYQICAYLENGSGGFGAGLISVKTGGVMAAGCN